jgi:hypothetical protein
VIDPSEPQYHLQDSRGFFKADSADSTHGNVVSKGTVLAGDDDDSEDDDDDDGDGDGEIKSKNGISNSDAAAANGSATKNVVPVIVAGFGTLDASGTSFKEKFLIRCYEVGMNGTASPETMANLLQVC